MRNDTLARVVLVPCGWNNGGATCIEAFVQLGSLPLGSRPSFNWLGGGYLIKVSHHWSSVSCSLINNIMQLTDRLFSTHRHRGATATILKRMTTNYAYATTMLKEEMARSLRQCSLKHERGAHFGNCLLCSIVLARNRFKVKVLTAPMADDDSTKPVNKW